MDTTTLLADPPDAQDRARRESRIDDDSLRAVMNTFAGRRFVWRLLDKTGMYRSTFNRDPVQMAFSEGIRFVGLDLVGWIREISPSLFNLMQSENNDR